MNYFEFKPHPELKVQLNFIGAEKQPLLIVDNFVDSAETLVENVSRYCQFDETTDYYPGVRSKMPEPYIQLLRASLGNIICETFSLNPLNISHATSYLSIVSTKPQDLSMFQQVPHFDGTNPKDIAFLHYLCDESHNGTSFYRHNKTSYEYVNQERFNNFTHILQDELSTSDDTKKYMIGDNDLFTRTESVPARFNRLLLYKGTSLHSGDIDDNYQFDLNPLSGRLTVTSFLYSKPKPQI